ncbi:PHP domain-containing protein [Candidatus Woesearchaeota archaeon]|nr:PHP domain-containing protein [Candidatus Woesearchaeota archaeon]
MAQVFFSRASFIPSPLFKMLRNVGFQAVDMHFHTEYSMDAVSDIRAVLARCRKRGYGVAITDHNDIRGAVKAWMMRKDEFVIPGIETSTKEGAHTLYYFYEINGLKRFYAGVVQPLRKKNPFFLPISIDRLMEKAEGYNAVVAAAHPHGIGRIGIKKVHLKGGMKRVETLFQLAEGLNGANLRKLNRKSISWARFIDKELTAGSDGHMTRELGNALTLAYGYDVESFLESVKKGYSVLLGKERNFFLTLIRETRKEKNYLKRAHQTGKGWLWVKAHIQKADAEIEELHKKIDRQGLHQSYLRHHFGVGTEDYKHYLKLGKGLF